MHARGAFLACNWCGLVVSAKTAPIQNILSLRGNMDALKQGSDALFILLGGIMVLAMHAGFAFLELGTVRKKNQVNALVKILVDFSVSTSLTGPTFLLAPSSWRPKMAMSWSGSSFC
jgi:hypothetical protein